MSSGLVLFIMSTFLNAIKCKYFSCRVYPWKLNVGLNSAWLGGPAKDADGTVSGGYVLADLAVFTDNYIPGFQRKAWLVSDVVGPTTARGRCLNFDFAVDGLNLETLRYRVFRKTCVFFSQFTATPSSPTSL